MVGGAVVGAAVAGAAQIDGGNGRAGPRLDGLVDDVVAQEAIATDDKDPAQLTPFLLTGHIVCRFWMNISFFLDFPFLFVSLFSLFCVSVSLWPLEKSKVYTEKLERRNRIGRWSERFGLGPRCLNGLGQILLRGFACRSRIAPP